MYYSWVFCAPKKEGDNQLKSIQQIKDEINISLHTNNSNLNKTFFDNSNNIFKSHNLYMVKKFSIVKRRSNNKLNKSLLTSLTL